MDRRFSLHDTTTGILCRRLGVLRDDVDTFNDHLRLIYQHFFYNAWLRKVLIVTGDNNYVVTFTDRKFRFKSCFHFFKLLASGRWLLAFDLFVTIFLTWLVAGC